MDREQLIMTKDDIHTTVDAYNDVLSNGTTKLALSFGKKFLARAVRQG